MKFFLYSSCSLPSSVNRFIGKRHLIKNKKNKKKHKQKTQKNRKKKKKKNKDATDFCKDTESTLNCQ